MAIFLQKVFLKRTRINPYLYWNSTVCGRMYYLRYPVAGAYVTGIQPEAVNPVINCHKCQPVVEVYVSNKRDMYRVPDISVGHRLDNHRRIAANQNITNLYLPCLPASHVTVHPKIPSNLSSRII